MGILCDGNDWATSTVAYNRTGTDHTVSIWVRVDSTTGTRRPFGNTGGWEMRAAGTTLTSDLLQSGTLGVATLTTGVYHHLAIVQDVTNTDRFFYVDGVLVNSVLSATFTGTQNGNMNIAVSPGGAGQGWNGALDDLRVYDRVLPLDEVQTLHTCRGRDGILDSLVHHWPMNEGAEGTTTTGLIDIVGGINCTTINNTPLYNYDAGITYEKGII